MKVASIFGARPQFIKAALLSRQFEAEGIEHVVINTGQHYDTMMADVFLQELWRRKPDYDLGIGSASHALQTASILERAEEVLERERPDCVIVYGDTNSTLGGALAAAKLNIPVVHVEAGLRSFNRRMPEELNRIVTDHLSSLLLAPGEKAAKRLLEEGVPGSRVAVVGDIMYDGVVAHLEHAARSTVLTRLGLEGQQYVLCTMHRAENTDDPDRLDRLFRALQEVSKRLTVVFPVHPRARHALEAYGLKGSSDHKIELIEPVGYLDMLALEINASVVATDSGGVQKEAFFLGVPCVILRNETEWTELVMAGWNILAPPDGSVDVAYSILSAVGMHGKLGIHPYGDGHAAEKISHAIQGMFENRMENFEPTLT